MTFCKRSILYSLLFAVAVAICPLARAQAANRKFTIYAFIPYRNHVAGGTVTSAPPLDQYLESVGIHPIKVIYNKRYLTDGQPDKKNIEAIAKDALKSPKVPVSFDTEFGNRFDPATVIPKVSEILSIFHQYNTVTPVGVYATAPQNTYAWKPNIDRFDALNGKYAAIAHQVDFLSPVLYNYEFADTAAWKRAAVYNIAAAKKYQTGKPILPYISPVILLQTTDKFDQPKHGPIRMLTEAEMLARLQTLYDLGADGCIVWASSNDRTVDGNAPVFDRQSGWGKALADFAIAHP